MGIRVGVDVGERSVGVAAVEYDDDGWPIRLLAVASHIHDGGMDPDTAKSPQSRLATAGVARRTRRLHRRRRRRLAELDRVLTRHGIPVPDDELPQTHDAWHARARLAKEFIANETERGELLSLALRHLARHRGWRNPWWKYERLLSASAQSPSDVLLEAIESARARFGSEVVGDPMTVADLVVTVLPHTGLIRPTKAALASIDGPVVPKVLQQDTLAEALAILAMQQIPEAAAQEIAPVLMQATAPSVPRKRIGPCALLPDQMRAPSNCLEFQEFRIRATVANLRIGGERLTDGQHDAVCAFLLGYRDKEPPRWREIAELLEVSPRQLARPTSDEGEQTSASSAPTDRTSIMFESLPGKSELGRWWRQADQADRAELVAFLLETTDADGEPDSAEVAHFLEGVTDQTQEMMEKLEFRGGRAAYSREALRRLNQRMRADRSDLHAARMAEFDLPSAWAPPRPSFDDFIEHPTVARVNTIVRRFLLGVTERWGLPDTVVVEHGRAGFFGPTALAEHVSEVRRNTAKRDKAKERLRAQGLERPTNSDVRREEQIQRQQSKCLYCGGAIGMSTSEMDHVVPRAGGGGNRRDNLVAVCKPCNSGKGRIPFAAWAERHNNPEVNVEAAVARVREWGQLPGETKRQRDRLVKAVQHRLTLTRDDDDFGDRSMESTSYAAVQMRARITSFIQDHGGAGDRVWAFAGAVTSEARKAGGVDDLLLLRDKSVKSRFDRRHHAIDAAVMTVIRPTIAQTLRKRTDLQAEHRVTQKYPEWRDYQGQHPGDVVKFQEWLPRIGALAELLRDQIKSDRVPVVRPLRLTPRIGSVHADTVQPLLERNLAGAFTPEEILQVVDNRLYLALRDEAAGGGLAADPARPARLGFEGREWVDLYPSNAAYLAVRRGAAAIGSSITAARVYAWESRRGFQYGMIRLYVGEFARIGFTRPGVDIFTEPLPAWSQAIRTANAQLLKRIETGAARQIGWIALRDELELDPEFLGTGTDAVSEFLKVMPERHWMIKGFIAAGKLTITPAYLAAEGLDDTMDEAVHTIVGASRGGVPLGLDRILSVPGATIIRRTALGSPRWTSRGLPACWRPQEAAEAAFDL